MAMNVRAKACAYLRAGHVAVLAAEWHGDHSRADTVHAQVVGHSSTYIVSLSGGAWSCTCKRPAECAHSAGRAARDRPPVAGPEGGKWVMRYVLIDLDGELHVKDGSYESARAEVGPDGWDHVRLPRVENHPDAAGWVNDDGHRRGLPRNIVGGLVLTGMGAAIMPYAGPVVFTGWEPHGQPNEVRGLDTLQIAVIKDTHDEARRALAGDDGLGFPAARQIAEQMRTAPAPTLTVRPRGDVFRFLGGRS